MNFKSRASFEIAGNRAKGGFHRLKPNTFGAVPWAKNLDSSKSELLEHEQSKNIETLSFSRKVRGLRTWVQANLWVSVDLRVCLVDEKLQNPIDLFGWDCHN